jgi:hypothetical protein
MPGILLLAGVLLLGALPRAAAQYFGSIVRAGSTLGDQGNAIARDAAGNVHVTGFFNGSVDFDPGSGTAILKSARNDDIFVAKYSPTGALIWAKRIGGIGDDQGNGIAVDALGNVLITGRFMGTVDFDPGVATFSLSASVGDIFVCKLDRSGNFVWPRSMTGNFGADGLGIAVDTSGNVLTTGRFTGTVDFDPGPGTVNLTSAGLDDIFVSKLDSSGNHLFARRMGGPGDDRGNGIAVDAAGNVLTTGVFVGTVDFNPRLGIANLTSAGGDDIFVSKLDSGGNFLFARRMGGTANDQGRGIAVDASGNVLTTGWFSGTADFDPGAGTASLTSAGSFDIFVSKLDSGGSFAFAKRMGGTSFDQASGIAVDASGNVLTTGNFGGTADFDPGAGTVSLTSSGSLDGFVSKLDSSGNFVFAKGMGGSSGENARGIAVDPASANIFTTGSFSGTADFDPGTGFSLNLTSAGNGDIFVSRLTVHSKVLWSQSGGPALIWTVDGLAAFAGSVVHGPLSGLTATSYASHRDGTGRLLWSDPTSGVSLLWKLDANDAFVSSVVYGPFPGYTAVAYTAAPDGSGRLLWRHTGGAQSLWNVDPNGQPVGSQSYPPIPGFTINSFVASSAQQSGSAIRAGSTTEDQGNAIARDATGNVYITGHFEGTVDFDPGVGTVNLTSAGGYDIFVAKYTPAGALVWAKGMGGAAMDEGLGIAVDAAGNVFTTGHFSGTADFDPGAGMASLTSAGSFDIFVSELDSSGNFLFAKRMGGTSLDFASGIAVDASGNVLTTGHFEGAADFDPGAGTVSLTSAGADDIFVSKLDSSGNFVWAKGMGGTSFDQGTGIAVDASGNVLTTGWFIGTADFDPGAGTVRLTSAGSLDIFVSKLDSSGNFVFAKGMGGTSLDEAHGIAVDASGNVLTTGRFRGAADFDPGAGTVRLTSAGDSDIFVSKLDGNGNFLFAKGMGGTGLDQGLGIAVDASGNVLTTGRFQGAADFDPGAATVSLTSAGSDDIFVSKLDSSGNFLFAKRMGGISFEYGLGIAVDPASANVFTTGSFTETADFDPGEGTANLTAAGSSDIFLSRLTVHSKVLWSQSGGPALIWTVDKLCAFVSSVTYGPFSGLTATSYASHRDGTARLLWTDPASGVSGLWKLDANDAALSSTVYSPFVGFMAEAYTAESEGSGRLLWRDTSGAQYLWYVDTNGQFVSGLGYGVVPGFAIKSFVASP